MDNFLSQLFSIPEDAPYHQFKNFLTDYLQQHFDPNYNAVMAEMYNMKKPNKHGSDTRGQTLEDLMYNDPRFRSVLKRHYSQSLGLIQDNQNPMNSDALNDYLMKYVYGRGAGIIRNKIEPGL